MHGKQCENQTCGAKKDRFIRSTERPKIETFSQEMKEEKKQSPSSSSMIFKSDFVFFRVALLIRLAQTETSAASNKF
jgi:hypothetical protein